MQKTGEVLPKGFVLYSSDSDCYTISDVLGVGGFGITYLAKNVFGEDVAIKELFPSGLTRRDTATGMLIVDDIANIEMVARLRQRFIRESENIARCQHRSIVRVYDTFQANGTAYMVMELVRGKNLKELIHDRGVIDYATTIEILREVSSALSYLHSHNIVHLDVKPDNIILSDAGRIVLIDFGLSRTLENGETAKDDDSTVTAVSEGYAAPEQYRSRIGEVVGTRSDVYSLAATAVSMLTGKKPPSPQTIREHPDAISIPEIPIYANDAIRRAMTYEPSRRTADVATFMSAFSDADHTAILSSAPRRRSVAAICANIFAVIAILLAALLAYGSDVLDRYYIGFDDIVPYALPVLPALLTLCLRRGVAKIVFAILSLFALSYPILV